MVSDTGDGFGSDTTLRLGLPMVVTFFSVFLLSLLCIDWSCSEVKGCCIPGFLGGPNLILMFDLPLLVMLIVPVVHFLS